MFFLILEIDSFMTHKQVQIAAALSIAIALCIGIHKDNITHCINILHPQTIDQ
jgi:hypothetical protein